MAQIHSDTMKKREKIFEELERISKIIPYPLYWTDTNVVVLGVNEVLVKAVGGSSDMIGKTPFQFYKPDAARGIVANCKAVMDTKTVLYHDESIDDITTGKTKYFTGIRGPILDENGDVIGLIGTSVEITAQKEAERLEKETQELRLKNSFLEERLATTRLFAASIAHEIRTPWTGVIITQILLEDMMPVFLKTYRWALEAGMLKGGEELFSENSLYGAETAAKVLHKSAHTAEIFTDMMLMKVSLEKPANINVQKLSVSKCVTDALDLYPLDEDDRKLIHWNPGESKSIDFMFSGDQTLFHHLIFNLIKNALYYLKHANKGEIFIWLSQDKGEHCLHFKDTGAGMSEEVRANLFQAFFSRRRHGTGIGLALCKKIMTDWGGSIECKSVQDEYTHFIMRFPNLSQSKQGSNL